MNTSSSVSNEFRRRFCRADLSPSGSTIELAATAAECEAIAARLGLLAIRALTARLEITPWRRTGLAVSGVLTADIAQICVVSLEEFETKIEHDVAARFAGPEDPVLIGADGAGTEIWVDPLSDDDPEVLDEGCTDLGEFVVECLATALDPYPRKPGCDFDVVMAELGTTESRDEDEHSSPFAVLQALKGTGDKG